MKRVTEIPVPAIAFRLFLLTSISVIVLPTSIGYSQTPNFTSIWKQIATLADREINESSGIVPSMLNADCFWTHNDSGDAPRLFLINREGKTIARVKLAGAKAIDWEGIAIAEIDGRPKLIVGDIGGNVHRRKSVVLYILSEPVFLLEGTKPGQSIETTASVEASLEVSTDAGVTNYEGIAFDTNDNSVIVFEKALFGGRVYSIPIPELPKASGSSVKRIEMKATLIGRSSIPYATACDISSDGRLMVVITYGLGFLITRRNDDHGNLEEWADALKRDPVTFPLPKVRQPEAVCFSRNSKSIFLTSEQLPTPLFEGTLPASE